MTRLAFQNQPKVRVDDREIKRLGPTYTVETLRELALENPQAQLYLVMMPSGSVEALPLKFTVSGAVPVSVPGQATTA